MLWMLRAGGCACAKMTSGRLLIGVDIMPGFKYNDRVLKSMPLHSNLHAHARARTHTAAGTLSGEAIFAKITLTSGINPECQHQSHEEKCSALLGPVPRLVWPRSTGSETLPLLSQRSTSNQVKVLFLMLLWELRLTADYLLPAGNYRRFISSRNN